MSRIPKELAQRWVDALHSCDTSPLPQPGERMSYIEDIASTPEGRKSLRRERFKLEVTEAICTLMQAKGLGYKELANALDVRKKYFKRMLDGSREIDLNDLADIADAFDTEVVVDFRKRVAAEVTQPQSSEADNKLARTFKVARMLDDLEAKVTAAGLPTQTEREIVDKIIDLAMVISPTP